MTRSSRTFVATLALLISAPAAPTNAATARPAPDFDALSVEARTSFGGTLRKTSSLSSSQRSLVGLISSAEKASSDRPCDALKLLRTLRERISADAVGRRTTLGKSVGPQVEASSLQAEAALLTRPSTKRCGGGAAAPSDGAPVIRTTPTADGVRVRISLPAVQFSESGGRGLRFPELFMNGMSGLGSTGGPGVPTLPVVLALPTGATASVATRVSSFQLGGVQPAPIQPPAPAIEPPGDTIAPDDPFFAPPPFQASKTAYGRTTATPPGFAAVKKLPSVAGLNLVLVRVAGAQSSPGSGRLRVATALDLDVKFKGATEPTFGSAALGGPFNRSTLDVLSRTIANWSSVAGKLKLAPSLPLCGEEMMIITPAVLRPAADRLAAARTRGGVISRVFEVGSGPGQIGTTTGSITSAISKEVNAACSVKPSHILLFGDTNLVPTFFVPAKGGPNDYYATIPSDLPYSPLALILPLGAVGRLPVSDLERANAVVDKIITYADAPPADNDFYARAAVAGYFQINSSASTTQESRAFASSAEQIRATLVNNGRTVDRLYEAKSAATPKKWKDGTSVPAALQKPTFAWDADAADIAGAWNAGRFTIFHIDHGGVGGWSSPRSAAMMWTR